MMNQAQFSDTDHHRLQAIKGELQGLLPQSQPKSEVIFRSAQLFVEVRDRGYYSMEDADDCPAWMHRLFKIGPHQAQKYFNSATLPPEEVVGKTVGVEGLNQIALAPPVLHETMWQLAEEERLSGGALAAGRLAALPHLRKGQLERACKELVKAAWKQAQKEMEQKERRKQDPEPPPQQVVRALARGGRQLEALLDKGLLSGADAASIRAEIVALIALDGRLAELEVQGAAEGPESAASRTSETSETAEVEVTQGVARPAGAPPAPEQLPEQMEPYRPLVRALRGQLDAEQAVTLRECLGRIIRGSPRRMELSTIKELLEARLSPEEEELLQQGLAQLDAADRVARGSFALEWLVAARPPGYETKLMVLGVLNLPAELREQVVLWRDRVGAGGAEAPGPPAHGTAPA